MVKLSVFVNLCLIWAFSPVDSAPFQDIAQNVKSTMILVDNPNAVNIGSSSNKDKLQVPEAMGEALDLFYRYGFFSLSVRVVPRDDPGAWLIREPTNPIFSRDSLITTQEFGTGNFEPYYQVYLCDDTNELMEAYFRDFKADGVAQPFKLYTGSWRKRVMAKYMGLSTETLDGESSFILVKLTKLNRIIKTQGNPILSSPALSSVSQIREGDKDSVLSFINEFGSHYVKEIKVGDVIYQVFALTKDQFSNAKNSLRSYQRIKPNEFNSLYEDILAPWNVRETGSVQTASGDFRLKKFLSDNALVKSKFSSYPSIFEFKNDPTLMTELERVSKHESEAVIGLHFGTLRSMIPSISTQDYFDEVVDTQMALWEINIS